MISEAAKKSSLGNHLQFLPPTTTKKNLIISDRCAHFSFKNFLKPSDFQNILKAIHGKKYQKFAADSEFN